MSAPKTTLYVETTIVSYIAARPSRDPFLFGCQQLTRRWWRQERGKFDLFTSSFVRGEASRGEMLMAKRRETLLKGIPDLELSDEVQSLATLILKKASIPPKAADDAIHIAMATVHKLDCLLSWNCRHISNLNTRRIVRAICAKEGYKMPELCSPYELQNLNLP